MRRYRRLLRYATRFWGGWLVIVAVTLLSTALGLLQPWPMQILVDHVLGGRPMPPGLARPLAMLPGASTPGGLLGYVVLAGLAIFAVESAVDVVLTFAWIRVGQRMVYDLAADLFARLQRRSLLFHSRNSVGDSISRVMDDSWCVHSLVDTLLLGPWHALITIAGIVIVMGRMDWGLTLLSLAVAPFLAGSSVLLGRSIRDVARLGREVESRIFSHVQQTLSGIPVVQAFSREEREHHRFQEYALQAIRAHQRGQVVGHLDGLISGLITTLGTAAILWIGARDVLHGRLTVGTLLVFITYLASLQEQMQAFTGIYGALQGAGASIDRVMQILETEPEVRDVGIADCGLRIAGWGTTDDQRPTTNDPPVSLVARPQSAIRNPQSAIGRLRLAGVTFGYEPGRAVLRDVSLEAAPGETVAIVGPTGAGKSTLVSLIPRFFDPWEGQVTLDGVEVRTLPLKWLRSQVALVLQEPFLFPVTIAENIAYGRPDASREEIEAAARAANAHPFIERLAAGYDTEVGERGATLSGGERQRLSIARALLKDAPILILDEPTSALDAETERLLLEALERLMAGRTTLIIAHRLSTIRGADKIVGMRGGRVVEEGRHEELVERGGLYARLYHLQSRPRTPVAGSAKP